MIVFYKKLFMFFIFLVCSFVTIIAQTCTFPNETVLKAARILNTYDSVACIAVDATYAWTGPYGFSTAMQTPITLVKTIY